MTAHPRAVFERAIERGNLAVAETVLREASCPVLVALRKTSEAPDALLEPPCEDWPCIRTRSDGAVA